MALVDVEPMVMVTGVMYVVLLRVVVMEAVMEVLVVVAPAIVIIVKGLDIHRVIATLCLEFRPTFAANAEVEDSPFICSTIFY
ncbi:hypothetical protein NL676_021754 [Syzygium grande]|nr:hypothetical protein NL676_021754 [Syzygium grande]